MTSGIYEILNTANNKRYIGSSIDVERRLTNHRDLLKRAKHFNKHLQSAYDKYDKDSFQFKLIVVCSKDDLEFYEELIIISYKANQREFGYNIREVSKSNRGLSLKYKSGDKYNRVTLIEKIPDSKKWICRCDCGTVWGCLPWSLKFERTKSCGCLNKEMASALMHKQHQDPEWSARSRKRSSETMKITMSRPENRALATAAIRQAYLMKEIQSQ